MGELKPHLSIFYVSLILHSALDGSQRSGHVQAETVSLLYESRFKLITAGEAQVRLVCC